MLCLAELNYLLQMFCKILYIDKLFEMHVPVISIKNKERVQS